MGKLVTSDATHLNGPLGLALAPNGDLIAANGDAFNPNSKVTPNLILEFTPQGKFMGQFQLDPGGAGGAFGLALQTVGSQIRFAAVDDNTNTLQIFTFDPASQSGAGGPTGNTPVGGMPASPPPSMGGGMPASPPPAMMGGQGQQSNTPVGIAGSPSNGGGGGSLSQIDAFFLSFNSMLKSLEAMELNMAGNNAQIDAFFQMVNSTLGSLESRIAGHPVTI
jgi:hypothetical protein